MNRAAISGVGVVSAFGVGAPAFFDGLARGRAAVGPIRAFDVSTFPVRVAGEVPDLPATDGARDRKITLGTAAALEAWRDAGCTAIDRGAALVAAVGLEQAFLQDFIPLLDRGHIDWSRGAEAGLRAGGVPRADRRHPGRHRQSARAHRSARRARLRLRRRCARRRATPPPWSSAASTTSSSQAPRIRC